MYCIIIGSFKLYDLDEDGHISRGEMLLVVDSIYRMVGDSVALRQGEQTSTERVDKIFSKNAESELSFDDFCKVAYNDPLVMNSINIYATMA